VVLVSGALVLGAVLPGVGVGVWVAANATPVRAVAPMAPATSHPAALAVSRPRLLVMVNSLIGEGSRTNLARRTWGNHVNRIW
jgi:hypothetical protein